MPSTPGISDYSGPHGEESLPLGRTKRVEVRDVTVTFESKGESFTAVSSVSFDVADGEVVCLLGPSGCGKSTLLRVVAGFIKPDSGEAIKQGKSIRGPGPDRGMVFQEHALFPWLTARKNIQFGLRHGFSADERRELADEWLERMRLEGFGESLPSELSGGMRQRVALARALAPGPDVLLMDEPFAALDAQTRTSMQEMLSELIVDSHTTAIFVTHDIDESLIVGDRILVMSRTPGTIIEDYKNPFPRRRSAEIFERDEYGRSKSHIFHLIRDQIVGQ